MFPRTLHAPAQEDPPFFLHLLGALLLVTPASHNLHHRRPVRIEPAAERLILSQQQQKATITIEDQRWRG